MLETIWSCFWITQAGFMLDRNEINYMINTSPSQWSRGLLLLAGVASSNLDEGMDVCVLSGRGLCYGPIPRSEESHRARCVSVWLGKTATWGRLRPRGPVSYGKGKGKGFPLQDWSGSWSSRRLRLLDLLDFRHYEDGKVVTLTHRPSSPPGVFLVLIFRGWVYPQGTWFRQ
jgi:hypothetical protein